MRLKELRLQKQITQKEVAIKVGCSTNNYARYERGERELPMHHFITLARYYNVSLDYLAGLIDTPKQLY